MKPFDLERALAGDPVVTRDGREVYGLTVRRKPTGDCGSDMQGYVVNANADTAVSWSQDGKWSEQVGKEFEYDLFMAPKKRTVWVNIHSRPSQAWELGHGAAVVKIEE